MTSLPVLGAAMPLDTLETHRDWLIADQRDLELQDFITAEVLNGDWQPLVARARALLDGYTGRLGIHGPFWGLTLDNPDPEIRAIVTKRMEQGLAVCEALGATQMVIHSPYTTWDYNNLDMLPNARQKLLDNVHATLDPGIRTPAARLPAPLKAPRSRSPSTPATRITRMAPPGRRRSTTTSTARATYCTTSTCRTRTVTPTGTGPSARAR